MITSHLKPAFICCLLFCLPVATAARIVFDSVPAPPQSRLFRFAETGPVDSDRAVLNVYVRDQEAGEPVLGATVLLQRREPEQVHGKITQWDGRCKFKVAPGQYNFRIQLTGMATFEKENIELLEGRQYDMIIEMARMRAPVPSAKQQARNDER